MIYFRKKNSRGEIIASNTPNNLVQEDYKQKDFYIDSGVFSLITDEQDLVKSSKIFKKIGEASAQIFVSLHKQFVGQIKAHSHTLKRLQGQLIQKLESIVENPMLVSADYDRQRDQVAKNIKEKPELAADVLLYAKKRIFELDAHIESFEVLHMGEDIILDIRPHNIRRLLINILHAFDTFTEQGIRPIFTFDDNFAESNKIKLDYKTINSAFYNFFDNMTKYAKPYTEVKFYFEPTIVSKFSIRVSMKSLRIERNELEDIFKLYCRGKNAEKIGGLGVGMYVVRKALALNKMSICVTPNYSDMETYDGCQYILNEFVISNL